MKLIQHILDDSSIYKNTNIINMKNKNSKNNYSLNNISNIQKYNKINEIYKNEKEDICSTIYDIPKLLNQFKNYWGSIYLQNLLNYLDKDKIMILLYNILPYIKDIMCSEYGNYFFQKFIKRLNVQQKLKIYQIIEPNFINIALNKVGTHSIQSLIDVNKTPIARLALNNLLNKDMLLLFNDKNAFDGPPSHLIAAL